MNTARNSVNPQHRRAAWHSALLTWLVGLAVSASPVDAGPKPKQFLANLNAGQETLAIASNAFGVAHLTFDEASKMLCMTASYSGLSSAESAAHIHGPALPGEDAGILFPLPVGSPKDTCVGPLDTDQKKALLQNELYMNVHTADNTSGEIRGQILRIK